MDGVYKQNFDLLTGQCLDDETVTVPSYATRVVNGEVQVAVKASQGQSQCRLADAEAVAFAFDEEQPEVILEDEAVEDAQAIPMKDTTQLCLKSPIQGTLTQLILGISFVGIALALLTV